MPVGRSVCGLGKNKYRSVQELHSSSIASFSGTFDLILFQAVNFEFIVEKVWFG